MARALPDQLLDVLGTVNVGDLISSGEISSTSLSVTGDGTFSGALASNSLNVNNLLSAGAITSSGSLTGSDLTINGNSNISGTLNAGIIDAGTLLVNGNPLPSSPWALNGGNLFYNSGSIGIGISTPSSELEVLGTITATDVITSGNLTSSGLNVNGDSSVSGTVTANSINATDALIAGTLQAGTVDATSLLMNGSPMVSSPWLMNGIETYFNGRVGIGLTNPNNSYALDVNGAINATSLLINGSPIDVSSSLWTQSGNDTYFNAGSVGIGTATPNSLYALDVAGTLNATDILIGGNPLPS